MAGDYNNYSHSPEEDLMPTIKCSNCHADVGISHMGDHVCAPPDHFAVTPPPESPHNHPDMFGYSPPSDHTLSMHAPSKPSRLGPPPPIDPSAANRPFLLPNPLTPADSDSLRSAHSAPSPLPSPGPKSPLRMLQRSQTSPLPPQASPKLSNFDCAFPPFPPRSNTIADSGMRSRQQQQRDMKPLPLSPDELVKEQLETDWDVERPISPVLPPTIERSSPRPTPAQSDSERRKSNRHRREVSIDSKMMQRLSMASSKFGGSSLGSPGSISGSISVSPGTMARNQRNVMEEIPPLPTGPIQSFTPSSSSGFVPEPYHFGSKEEFEHDRALPVPVPEPVVPVAAATSPRPRTRNRDGRRTAIYGSFDFALPPDLPRDNDGNVSFGDLGKLDAPKEANPIELPPRDEKESNDNNNNNTNTHDDSPGPSYRLDEDFSVSNFVRGLGISDPYHSANVSTSSSASGPSEAASGSSFSSHPSERRKPSDEGHAHSHLHSNSNTKPVDASYKQNNEPLRPLNLQLHNLDSPTDPAFQNGHLSNLPSPNPNNAHGITPSITPPPRPSTATGKGRCRGCSNIITGKSVSSKDGRLTGRYHKACFVCHTCREPFSTSSFYVHENEPYCAHHYHSINGTLCSTCKQGIEGEYLETDEPSADYMGRGGCQKFHPQCFKCHTCRVVLRGDYLEFEGRVYCERDGRRAASAVMMPPPPPSPRMMMHPPPPHMQGGGPRRPPMPPPQHGYGPGPGPPGPGPYGPRFPSGNPNRAPHLGVPGMYGGPMPPMPMQGPGPGPAYPGPRRFPERRTTRLMMT